jgi:glycosyltransferase involved in cell wall biosynthesis
VRSTKTLIGCELQVIVVDDGSTDATPEVLELLKREIPSLLTLRQRNGGLSSARNYGLSKACGDYVLFLDADDMLLPCDVAPLLETGSHMIRIGVEEVREGEPTLVRAESEDEMSGRAYLSRSFNANSFYTASCAYLYHVDWLRKKALLFEDKLLHEDNLFTVQALLNADTVQIVPTLLYRYIRRPDSITTASGDDRLLLRIQSYGRIARHLTRIANQDRTFDLRWKIQEVLDGAQRLASQCTGRLGQAIALRSLLHFMFIYRGYGGHGFRLEQLKRLKRYLRSYVMHRPISRSEY